MVHDWWRTSDETGRINCDRAILTAIAGGHQEAVAYLISQYEVGTCDVLKQALESEQHRILELLCEKIYYGTSICWAAEHGKLEVMKLAYRFHHHYAEEWNFYEAVHSAVGHGHLDIVIFLNEHFGEELYRSGGGDRDGCPLTNAIKGGKVEIAKYLYHNNGYKVTSFGMAFAAAAAFGPVELVELFCADARCNVSLVNRGFELAAGGGQLPVMKLLRSKEDFDPSSLDKAFTRAAGCGQVHVLEHFYNSEGYQPLASSFGEAAILAGGGGHLGVIKFLDSKGGISDELSVKVFMSAANDDGLKCVEIDDQARVLSFFYSRGCISSAVIIEAFLDSATRSGVDVVEFLFNTGLIPADVVNEAFQEASWANSAAVVEFLYKSGKVSPTTVEMVFRGAAKQSDTYVVETLYNCGCTSKQLLREASRLAPKRSVAHLFLSRE